MTTERKLHAKLAQVMYEAERIPKNGRAPQAMGGFEFVQVGDAADVIRKALAEKSISMIPSAVDVVSEAEHPKSNGGVTTTLTVRTTWTLTDGETGETATIQSIGSGADSGDKAAPKAQTNAMKYALLMGFLLSTGDDPEQFDSGDRQSTQRPRTQAPADARNAGAAAAAARPAAMPTSGPVVSHGWSEGQQHDPTHKPLRARPNGHLFCPTKLPNGAWCDWQAEQGAKPGPVAAKPVAVPDAAPEAVGPAAGATCGVLDPYDKKDACNLLPGHPGPSHRVLDADGKPRVSWPVAA